MIKITYFLTAAFVMGALLTGCGSKSDRNAENTATNDTTQTVTEATTDATSAETTEENIELTQIVVGATAGPQAAILNSYAVMKVLFEQGYSIKDFEFTDYVPNESIQDGSFDANFCQHVPDLDDYNTKNGTTLKAVASVYFEPLGIYPGKTATLDALKDGAQIAVPNDTTNEARALLLLQKAGLITLKENVGLEATKNDILDNPKNVKIVEIEAAQTAKALQDVDVAVINENYALSNGLFASEDALLVEDAASEAATTYAIVIVVKEGDEESDKTKALIKAVTSEETKTFINEQWKGAVVPVF